MTSQKIVLSDQDHGLGQIGGGARLKDASLWPRSPDTGEPMIPLLTLSERFLPVSFIPPSMAITVFITARQHDGAFSRSTQRHYTVNQQSELDEKRANGFAGSSCTSWPTSRSHRPPQPSCWTVPTFSSNPSAMRKKNRNWRTRTAVST
ncbi:hypothetical protein LZ838_10325 [Pseudomonas sp. AA27]|uniref:hypothetical protein n=1 Tax=Pseudomonas sp. AA27 TaxID=2908652 RepID=UPI001F3AB543|nr:hypothetical protein [Pseudomonas sp. AA27]MCF1487759.1 hypothetical protein [Pseudomonas sp. AA27]